MLNDAVFRPAAIEDPSCSAPVGEHPAGISVTAQLLGHLGVLLQEAIPFQVDPDLRNILEESAAVLLRSRLRLQAAEQELSVAFVGLSNVGKSTLLSALFGMELAPRRNGPCTPAVVEYRYHSHFQVRCQRGVERSNARFADAESTLKYLAEMLQHLDTVQNQVVRVRVGAPVPMLQQGITLIDTPGFGAARPDDDARIHDQRLSAFLADCRMRVVWVANGQQGITAAEQRFFSANLVQCCDDVVVTSCEGWSAQERARFRDVFRQQLGRSALTFHFVSALEALQGRTSGDQSQIAASGLPDFERRIRDACDRRRLSDLAIADAVEMLEAIHELRHSSAALWREDSWYRWQRLPLQSAAKAALDRALEAC